MKLQLKRSNVLDGGAAKEPTALQMEYGELAVNYNNGDPAIFIKDSNDNIIRIAGVGNISSGDTPSGDILPPTGNNVGDIFFNTLNETLYYWDGSQWVPIANDTTAADIFVGTLTEINTQVPETNRRNGFLWWNTEDGTLYVWYIDTDTSQWVIAVPASGGGGSGASVTVLDAPPTTPEQGDLWWNTTDGRLYIWYEDGDTNQWVDAAPNGEDGLWLENAGYLSPKDGTNGVEIGSGAITLDAAGDIVASSSTQVIASGKSAAIGSEGVHIGKNGGVRAYREAAGSANSATNTFLNVVNANVAINLGWGDNTTTDNQYKGYLTPDGGGKFAGDMAIGITGSFTPSTPAITLSAADGLASFAGGDVAIEKHSSNDNKRINVYSGDTTQSHASFGTFDSVNSAYTNRLNHDGSAQFLSWSAAADTPGFNINPTGLLWKSPVADADKYALTIYSGPINNDPTVKIANNGNIVTVGDIQSTSQNGGQLAGFRNQLINGDFRIWQRGTDFVVPPASAQFTVDRWFTYSATPAIGQNTIDTPDGFDSAIVTKALGEQLPVRQSIELLEAGKPGQFTIGSTWTLSFWAKGSGSGHVYNASVGFAQGSATNPTTTRFLDVIGETLTTTTWTKYSHTFTVGTAPDPADVSVNVTFAIKNGTGFNYITGCQLEPGPVATPFEHRPYGIELALCQRYYQVIDSMYAGVNKITSGTTGIKRIDVPRTVTMRTNPTEAAGTISSTLTLNGTANVVSAYQLADSSLSSNTAILNYTADAEL